jgi:hypothetical protein
MEQSEAGVAVRIDSSPLTPTYVKMSGGGRIGMTFCLGKVQRDSMSGKKDKGSGMMFYPTAPAPQAGAGTHADKALA